MADEGKKKDTKEKTESYDEIIRKLEKRIENLEKEGDGKGDRNGDEEGDAQESTVESVVGQLIPGLGGIVRALEKSSPEFRRRIAQTDVEIEHRLETGWSSKPEVNHGISIRPLTVRKGIRPEVAKKEPDDVKAEAEEREPIIDIFEEKDYISVIAELPGVEKNDIETKLSDSTLEISAGKYRRTIRLPSVPKSIIEKNYNNGILQLKIEREGNAC